MKKFLFAAVMAATTAVTASAQTIVVTPGDLQGWAPNSLAGDATVGITAVNPRGLGTGSLQFTGNSSDDRTRFATAKLTPGGFGLLNQLSTLSFDWFRTAQSSPTSGWHTPVFRMIVADLGAPTPITFREIIWEYDYQFSGGNNVAPTGNWIDDQNLLTGNWYTNAALNDANASTCPVLYGNCLNQAGNWGFSDQAFLYAISIGTGSGWVGNFEGFADDVKIGFKGGSVTTYDFELESSAVPEPSTYVLLVAGLAGLFVAGRRRTTNA